MIKKIKKLEKTKAKRITQLSSEIKKLVRSNQNKLLRKIEPLLDNLSTDIDDKIKFSSSNISLQNKIQLEVKKFTASSKQPFVRKIIAMINEIIKLDVQILKLQVKDLSKKAELKAKNLVFKSFGFDLKNGKVISGGYLDAVVSNASLATRVGSRVANAVSSGAGVKSFKKDFRKDFPTMSNNNFNTFSQTFIGQVSNSYSSQIAKEVGNNYFIYSNTSVDDTRQFCLDRIGIMYTREFVESEDWSNSNHKGAITGNFFQNLGGFRCTHNCIYLSDELAEELLASGEYELNTYN